MPENAWPFLIGRTRNAGYRVVVVPEFMAEPASVDALSAAAGDVRLPADAACVREVRGLPFGTVTVVYRSFTPRGGDYGLGVGDLTDGFGRPIRVTEGVVLRCAAALAAPARITVADLECAHAAVADAYRDFWEGEREYVRRTSVAYPLGAAEHSPRQAVRLKVAEPWGSERGVRVRVDAGTPRSERGTFGAILVGAAVLIAALAVGGELLAGALRSAPKPPAATVLADFCDALKAGLPNTAYRYTAPQLRDSLSSASFTEELLSTAPRAMTCTYVVDFSSASDAHGTVTVDTGSAPPTAWSVALAPGTGASWVINSLIPAF